MNKGFKLLLMSLLIVGMSCGVAMGADPVLSDESVSPDGGDTSQIFTFEVKFTDDDNDTADYVTLTINGGDYTLDPVDLGDVNTTDGKMYINSSVGPFSSGDYGYTFSSFANGSSSNEPSGTLTVTSIPAPQISSPSPSPSSDPVETDTGDSQAFSVDVDQDVTVVWTIGDTEVQNSSATASSTSTYSNASAELGSYTVKAYIYNANGNDSHSWTWDVANPSLSITDFEPSDDEPESFVNELQTFNATTNQDCTFEWYLDDVSKQTDSGFSSSYEITPTSIGTYTVRVDVSNPNGTASQEWNWEVQPKTFYSGDRIWEEDIQSKDKYTWNYLSYSGFYYDLDTGEGSESMTMEDIGRDIDSGDLTYETKAFETEFESSRWNEYEVIGFMAEKYFAGYPEDAFGPGFDEVPLMSEGILSKVLIDDDDKKSVYTGAGLVLEDGYVLNIVEVDINGDRVYVKLSKDGDEIDEGILSSGSTYIYEKDIGDVDDVPIIAVYFKEIFSGIETNAVFVEGIFQISDEYLEIDRGDDFGEMEIDSVDSDSIKMSNEDDISLDKGDIVDIMGKLKFIVADSGTLRFAPFVDMSEPGTYELRGTVVEEDVFKWTPMNFEGFYYNIDEGIGTESLEVLGLDGNDIEEGNLTYTTRPDNVSFEYGSWGEYEVIGFMAEKYFAGYPDDAFESGFDEVSLMEEGMLSKVLIDDDDKKSVYGGSSLILEEGYALDILEVDINGEKVFVELNKDGDRVDSTILSSGDPYIYDKDLGDAEDVPIIVINFDEIFSGRESTAVFVEGIFQISEDYLEIEEGDDFGEMEVSNIEDDIIEMENEDEITLSDGDEIEIMGEIQFKVADSNTLRYYPFVEVTVEPDEALDVEIDPEVTVEGDEVVITVTSRGSLISDATVKAGSLTLGTTDDEGIVEYEFVSDGTYDITAEKDGYATGTAEVEVISPDDLSRKMSIEVTPEVIYEGNLVTFTIVKAIGGDPMDDVRISLDGKTIGQTGSDGVVTDVITEPGMHKIVAEKSGFLDAELNIEVKEMQAKFEFSDLVLDPIEVRSGKDVKITLNAVNNGNAEGSYSLELKVNDNVTDFQEIALGINESTEVTFDYTAGEPGSYLVKVGGMTATLEVVEGVSTIVYLLGGLAVAVLGGAAYLFTAGGWTVETAGPKASEAMAALSERISNLLSRGKE
ncbi:S-layer protein [Methanococcoides orientis]|uniref:S-layer protein domain-containing protein n=1 Tax=Methanococcoides orientis TaxID=2822137 RepID=UPI001E2FEE81|nr:S-layer protein domain-containing protein [Methanococcoides orientis]UGV40699.1 S-layer protein [Methanococcoides orientis]